MQIILFSLSNTRRNYNMILQLQRENIKCCSVGMDNTCEWWGRGSVVMAARSCPCVEGAANTCHLSHQCGSLLPQAAHHCPLWHCWTWPSLLFSVIHLSKDRRTGNKNVVLLQVILLTSSQCLPVICFKVICLFFLFTEGREE